MNDRMVDLAIIALTILSSGVTGVILGAWFTERAWTHALERTGVVRPEPTQQPGAVHSRAPVNTEVSAQRNIAAASLERGALDIQERYRANGRNISLKEARAEAAAMLSSDGALGGVT